MTRLVYPFEAEYATKETAKSKTITRLGDVLALAQTELPVEPNLRSMLDDIRKSSNELDVRVAEIQAEMKQLYEKVRTVQEKELRRAAKRIERRVAAEARLKAYADSVDEWF